MITAQFSLYPLRTTDLGPAIESAVSAIRTSGLEPRVGVMSSYLEGDEEAIFSALRAAFRAAAAQGDAVLIATVSNACKRDGGEAQ